MIDVQLNVFMYRLYRWYRHRSFDANCVNRTGKSAESLFVL